MAVRPKKENNALCAHRAMTTALTPFQGVGTYEPAGAAAFRFPSHPVYADWDFGSVWTIVGGLPQLIWQQ